MSTETNSDERPVGRPEPAVALHDWYREYPRHTVGGSLYAVPAELRVAAARRLQAAGCRIHVDVIVGPDGHRGVGFDEVAAVRAAVPAGRIDLHLIAVAGADAGAVAPELVTAALAVGADAVTLPAAVVEGATDAVATLRAAGVQVNEEIPPASAGPAADRADIDGCLVMLIESGTKQAADPANLAKIERLSPHSRVGVDGGVTRDLARACYAAGARYLVSGRDLFAVTTPSRIGAAK